MIDSVLGSPPPRASVRSNVRTDPLVTVKLPESSNVPFGTPAGVTRIRYVPGATVAYGDAAPNARVRIGVAEMGSPVGPSRYTDTGPGAAARWIRRSLACPAGVVRSSRMNSAPNCDSPLAGIMLYE